MAKFKKGDKVIVKKIHNWQVRQYDLNVGDILYVAEDGSCIPFVARTLEGVEKCNYLCATEEDFLGLYLEDTEKKVEDSVI